MLKEHIGTHRNIVLTMFEDVKKRSQAANIGINDADFDNSDGNTFDQSNNQNIKDIAQDSSA